MYKSLRESRRLIPLFPSEFSICERPREAATDAPSFRPRRLSPRLSRKSSTGERFGEPARQVRAGQPWQPESYREWARDVYAAKETATAREFQQSFKARARINRMPKHLKRDLVAGCTFHATVTLGPEKSLSSWWF